MESELNSQPANGTLSLPSQILQCNSPRVWIGYFKNETFLINSQNFNQTYACLYVYVHILSILKYPIISKLMGIIPLRNDQHMILHYLSSISNHCALTRTF